MAWKAHDYECLNCNNNFDDITDNSDGTTDCPKCKTTCKPIPISSVNFSGLSVSTKEEYREKMLKRSADHTLKEIKKEPEKHGELGIQRAREGHIQVGSSGTK